MFANSITLFVVKSICLPVLMSWIYSMFEVVWVFHFAFPAAPTVAVLLQGTISLMVYAPAFH